MARNTSQQGSRRGRSSELKPPTWQPSASASPSLVAAGVLSALKDHGIHSAIGGSLALSIEGFDIGRPPDDVDVVILDDAPDAGQMRKALCVAGCRNVPDETVIADHLKDGHAAFLLGKHNVEIQVPAAKVAKARPHAKANALRLLQHTRSNVALVGGLRIIRSQNVAIWKAIFGRDKDRRDLKVLIDSTNAAGEPAITNANELVDYTRAVAGSSAAAWVDELLFKNDCWYAAY